MISVCVAIFFLLYVLSKAILLTQASFSQGDLDNIEVIDRIWPQVSIVVAARNEEAGIENALRSLIALDYPALEILVVNDRSTDQTQNILMRLAGEFPQLRVVQIHELRTGWIGKNNALDQGSRVASGEYILFCDADIVLTPDCLKRAVAHLLTERLDHLSLLIRVWSRSYLTDAFIPFFGQNLMLYFRPWEAKNPLKKNRYMGVGAFNLIRREVLVALRFFEQIPLRPDDDVKLGKLVKINGYRQDCLAATKQASVEWYPSFRDCVVGLEKNTFAGTDYRISLIIVGVLATLLPVLGPLFVAIYGTWFWKGLTGLTVLGDLGVAYVSSRLMGSKVNRLCIYPLVCLLYAGILVRTTYKNLREGGLTWRGTFYPLKELKKNVI
jgi:cellulose synthase/poly-beta-1,6-N-acetylglucosamine synthase-like glycosyltransferase